MFVFGIADPCTWHKTQMHKEVFYVKSPSHASSRQLPIGGQSVSARERGHLTNTDSVSPSPLLGSDNEGPTSLSSKTLTTKAI